jgi:CRISPR/Cas system-associated exonuclease Cas4 (RecB family)
LDPLTRGALFHEVQFALFGELERRGWLPARPEQEPEILALGDAVLERVAAQGAERLAPALPGVWREEVEELRLDLRHWLRRSVAEQARWKPALFEFSFGLRLTGEERDRRDAASVREEAVLDEGLRVRGSIDLVEESAGGDALRVTDHKTGKVPAPLPRVVGGGAALQPLLYALAAAKLLGRPVVSGRLFYCTVRGGGRAIDIPLDNPGRRAIAEVAGILDTSIAQGILPAAPRTGACERCDYRLVCGPHEELRAARKPASELPLVQQLRRMR